MTHVASTDGKPTVVLVHGAFADASSWMSVIERLQARGIPVSSPPNPLRGLSADTAYLASFLNQTPGPVVLAGHSYGGAVISAAASQAPNVVGLVFVAAFATDEGELLGQVTATSKDAILGPALVGHAYPLPGGGSATEQFVDPDRFHEVFAADLPANEAAVLAATQRPVAEAAFTDVAGPAAWKHLPSWAVVARGDKAAGTDITRAHAERAGAAITEVDGSHLVMLSQPDTVAGVILEAVAMAAGQQPVGSGR
jgi:pimeloyl-ACP methyl ester carboxylesterase